ncbi:MAG: acetyl-CoA carboxylase biotin carboxyl carrier protein subunit [candidate division NC10 bacterium]|nr:acetyl-CoA carboxylase biotin carboxyl carrier protein subunit [candidate division NC10 bacterium]
MAYLAWEGKGYGIEVMETSYPWTVKVDEAIHHVDILPVEEGLYSLLVDGRSYEVDVLEEGGALLVFVGGQVFRLEPQEEKKRLRRRVEKEVVMGRQAIVAPMPGKIVKVLVGLGDQVQGGDGVVIIEAMKMQNELKAARPGTVREVKVADGQGVKGGDVLVVIE